MKHYSAFIFNELGQKRENVLSLFYNYVDTAMANPLMVLKELKRDLVSNFGDDISDVILFGSQASGKSVEDSDYDILILLSHDYDWRYQNLLFDKAFDVGLKYQVLFDLHLLSSNERDHSLKGKEPIIIHALEKGIYA